MLTYMITYYLSDVNNKLLLHSEKMPAVHKNVILPTFQPSYVNGC